jgi:hypothetical protein
MRRYDQILTIKAKAGMRIHIRPLRIGRDPDIVLYPGSPTMSGSISIH